MPKSLIALLVMTVLALPVVAEKPEVKFDQGVDTTTIMRSLNGGELKKLAPLAKVTGKLRKIKRSKKMTLVGPGTYPPVSPLITGSAPYAAGLNLKVDPKYSQIPSSVLQPIESDWSSITSVRSDLLSKASAWEGDNGTLYNDGAQLDQESSEIDTRKANLNAEIGRYNQSCTGRPLPPDEYNRCVAWRNDLINRSNQLDADIKAYNARVAEWNQRSSSIFERRKVLIVDISNWETHINQWQDTVRKAMAAVCRRLKSLESRPPQATVFTGGFSADFEARTFFENEPKDAPPCSVDLRWKLIPYPDVPGKPIGTISPTAGSRTTFKSGDVTGIATLTVEDTNSGNGTASTVNLKDPANKK